MKSEDLFTVIAHGKSWSLGVNHPENQKRTMIMERVLQEYNLKPAPCKPLHESELTSTHIFPQGTGMVKEDHLLAAGAAQAAIEAVLNNTAKKALVCARPPGHHATRLVYGTRGFCTINNDALAINWLLHSYPDKRLVIVDSDAHHADGTEDIFFHDNRILHISLHQDGRTIFPGSGSPEAVGSPLAPGLIRNIPLPPGAGDTFFLKALHALVLPIIEDFKPDLIMHAVGFDGHKDDYLSGMAYSSQLFGEVTRLLSPNITFIQGGYDLNRGIKNSLEEVLNALLNIPLKNKYTPENERWSNSEIDNYIREIRTRWRDRIEEVTDCCDPDKEWVREQSFFYDEDYMTEHRRETVITCSNCPGLLILETQCDKRFPGGTQKHLLTPKDNLCPECHEKAKFLA